MVEKRFRVRVGMMLSGTILTAVVTFQLGCPAAPPPPPPPSPDGGTTTEGVTASQVDDMLAGKLGTLDRDLTLWNIQPGLGTVMIEYGRRFAMAQLAAQAGDWGMAQYQIKEAIEIQEVGETTRPGKAELLKAFEDASMTPLQDDIAAKDIDSFNADVANAINGCNGCHVATDHGFVTIQAPVASPEDFLLFDASEPTAPEASESESSPAPSASDSVTPLSWAELTQRVDDAFDKVDRSLTLWNIQPGLGTVMIEYGLRFAMLRSAVDAGDWGMAQYQLKEQIEIQEVGETTRPGNTDLLKNFEQTSLDPLGIAIENQDEAAFNTAYARAIDGCNGCHVATGHPYVRVDTPPTLPQPFLALGATDAQTSESGPEAAATPPSFPSGQPTVADAEALIQDRLNTLDRSLALWNIQPGLGTVMMEYGYRFALARLAVDAGNWGMAAYQIKEATEIQEVGEVTRPGKATLLENFEQSFLEEIDSAIAARDAARFDTAYTEAITGCNACHLATGHPFVVIQEPPDNMVDFLDLVAAGS